MAPAPSFHAAGVFEAAASTRPRSPRANLLRDARGDTSAATAAEGTPEPVFACARGSTDAAVPAGGEATPLIVLHHKRGRTQPSATTEVVDHRGLRQKGLRGPRPVSYLSDEAKKKGSRHDPAHPSGLRRTVLHGPFDVKGRRPRRARVSPAASVG